MNKPTFVLLAWLVWLLMACGSATPPPASEPDSGALPTSEPTMAGMEHGAMGSAMEEMGQLSGDAFEIAFLDAMIPHHQSAIEMAEVALERAQRPEVKAAAQAIITAQEAEIEQMTVWLQAWHGREPSGNDHGMAMPDEVARLRALPAEEFDAAFLVAMIPHHEDAVHMAGLIPERTQRPELRALGEAIIQSQQAEIEQFRAWLKAAAASPYVAQLTSPVRGLSTQEVEDLLAGRGAGYARSAELNRYPGPRHLLDLRAELALTVEQVAALETIFDGMQTEAQRLGATIVAAEAALSDDFATGTVAESTMHSQVIALATLYGELRTVHLAAHLASRPLLSEAQVARYDALRGYAGGASPSQHHSGSHP